MSRRAIIAAGLVVVAVVAIVLLASGGEDEGDGYKVRAIFDSGGFMVKGEQVRVAGANVGTIESVDVTMPGETVEFRDGEPVAGPGKAVIVMDIEDPGFQDFREDATCQIRPQSLIGEKFIDCRTTLPRAPGSPAPPPLRKVPDGEEGAGQYLLPLGSSGTSVDPDLINNIQTLPYAQRFRLIFNELGAGFAGRGEDIETLVKRANPVLRDVDRLFGILSHQRDRLAQLTADSDQILAPLARERSHFAGFLSNAGAAAQASSERGEALEASLRKFPTFLREFRITMRSFEGFSEAATPVFADLGKSAPSFTDATRTLVPFSEATTVALRSLGETGAATGPVLREADPVVRKSAQLAKTGVSPTTELARLFVSLKKTKGWDGLVSLIYNTTATTNAFDQYGHFGRTRVTLSTCLDYEATKAGYSGGSCAARFNGPFVGESANTSSADLFRLLQGEQESTTGGTFASPGSAGAPTTGLGRADSVEGEAGLGEASQTAGTEPLLDYLLGP
jgi:phospholipid/cholesterol/gamma-HCH transport system substrate-binding protein